MQTNKAKRGTIRQWDCDIQPFWDREWLIYFAQFSPILLLLQKGRQISKKDTYPCDDSSPRLLRIRLWSTESNNLALKSAPTVML
mmetsp:Transcript_14906/g.30711  ORF Transcript_14906/g.30711 Transcript_14906/m.30711 type:complete len:85 (-) Transcript_14906:221-475(-)